MPLPELIIKHSEQISDICKNHYVEELYLFGSATSGNIDIGSDLDFLVTFKPLEYGDYTDNYFQLVTKLESLLGLKIDLITKNSLTNPYFIKSIKKDMSKVYV